MFWINSRTSGFIPKISKAGWWMYLQGMICLLHRARYISFFLFLLKVKLPFRSDSDGRKMFKALPVRDLLHADEEDWSRFWGDSKEELGNPILFFEEVVPLLIMQTKLHYHTIIFFIHPMTQDKQSPTMHKSKINNQSSTKINQV